MLLLKNSIKKIFKSFGRFLSISIIIFIGIAVFTGLREATPGMLHTADVYYDEHNLMDFKVTSTYGLNEDDINSIKNLTNVQKVIPSYSADVLVSGKSVRFHALENDVNNVLLIEGKMPASKEECLGDYKNYQIGNQIILDEPNEYLLVNKCTIVGTIKSPLYINNSYGISNIGDGKLSSFIFIDRNAFTYEFATEAYIIAKNTKDLHSYKNDYVEEASKLKNEILELKPLRETLRYEEILKTANDEITKIKKELDSELSKNTKLLNSTKDKLDKSKELLNKTKRETLIEIESNIANLNTNRSNIIDTLNTNGITEENLNETILSLEANIEELKKSLELLPEETEQYNKINITVIELENKLLSLKEAEHGLSEIDLGLSKVKEEQSKFEVEIHKQEIELQNGYDEYNRGLKKLNDSKNEAEEKIKEAEKELDSIEKPIWYLLDRDNIPGYQNYKSDALKVEAISEVLPLFFVIVVMLMCLNTLTRLREEERTEIGILSSNGFSKTSIILNYLYYVFASTTIGIIFGLTSGYTIISNIIYGVFASNYYLEDYIPVIDKTSLIIIISITFALMSIVTILACNKELKDKPANLLRPKPPKSGKKVFLERFKKIWNRLSFMSKITIRNLFRYKSRIIMTILGVSGCTALLLTGFGLNDSINIISKLEYTDIIKYKSMITMKNEVLEIPSNIEELMKKNDIHNSLLINQNAYKYTYDKTSETVYVITPSNIEQLNSFISLTDIETKESINLSDDGAIITSQMADQLKVKPGDSIELRNSDNELFIINVAHIVENYISHYIYMSPKYYEEVFKTSISYNNILTDNSIEGSIDLNLYNLYSITNTIDILDTFDTFIKSINNLILLIIICACLLAFAVLYNLTIINVNERKREIATFKVLGFKDTEIYMFIYRETLLLTILGSLVGTLLGIYLHRFVILKAQTGNILFLCNIEPISYIFAIVLTIIFSFIVELLINHTLRKIDMIDSLKSVE